jgi:hypothetical protein
MEIVAAPNNSYAHMRRAFFLVSLALLCSALLGCRKIWNIHFINGCSVPLVVDLSGEVHKRVRLGPANSHSVHWDRFERMTVSNGQGVALYGSDSLFSDHVPPRFLGHGHVYVLLTSTNVLLIPPEYSKTWKEHIDEITKANSGA